MHAGLSEQTAVPSVIDRYAVLMADRCGAKDRGEGTGSKPHKKPAIEEIAAFSILTTPPIICRQIVTATDMGTLRKRGAFRSERNLGLPVLMPKSWKHTIAMTLRRVHEESSHLANEEA